MLRQTHRVAQDMGMYRRDWCKDVDQQLHSVSLEHILLHSSCCTSIGGGGRGDIEHVIGGTCYMYRESHTVLLA